jgi:hypothetical protein
MFAMLEKTVIDAAATAVKVVDAGLKKAWSILDAAGEKKAPSEYLSKNAISAIQGKIQGS